MGGRPEHGFGWGANPGVLTRGATRGDQLEGVNSRGVNSRGSTRTAPEDLPVPATSSRRRGPWLTDSHSSQGTAPVATVIVDIGDGTTTVALPSAISTNIGATGIVRYKACEYANHGPRRRLKALVLRVDRKNVSYWGSTRVAALGLLTRAGTHNSSVATRADRPRVDPPSRPP